MKITGRKVKIKIVFLKSWGCGNSTVLLEFEVGRKKIVLFNLLGTKYIDNAIDSQIFEGQENALEKY